ncbi:MAG: hypothetical protein HUM72_12655 [Dolichospermum sp.]|nr:hypothetical protein [Dolichospermum sp.]
MSTFQTEAVKTVSEKVTLVTIESAKPAKIFNLYSGSVYYKDVDFFVSLVKQGTLYLASASSIGSMFDGSFFYSISEKRLYIRSIGSVNPKNVEIIIFYRHFFSNRPTILPFDLASGQDVEWLPFINSIGSVGQQLDDQSTGIVLETSSSIDLLNMGYFDSIYDTHIWENKTVKFYAWFVGIAATESKQIFEGTIESKDFSTSKVSFKVKDFIFRFRDQISHNLFSSSDGYVSDKILGTPKRRIYGQVKQVKCVGTDLLLDGFYGTGSITVDTSLTNLIGSASAIYVSNDISGTVSGSAGTRTVTGLGTNFTSIISPNQKIRVTNGLATYNYTVFSVDSATSLTLTSDISVSFSAFTSKNSSLGNSKIYGVGSNFLAQLQQGSSVTFTNGTLSQSYKVESIESDVELTVSDFVTATFYNYNIINNDQKNNNLVGSGTLFINEISVGDTIKFSFSGEEVSAKIESIYSNTLAKVSNSIIIPITNKPFTVVPERSFYNRNRVWNVAGHKLREPTTSITSFIANNRFILGSTEDLYPGDKVLVGGVSSTIRRISGNELITETEVSPTPTVGSIVKKIPIQNVFFDFQELVYLRDWSYSNTTECRVILNSNAEFNVTKESILGVPLQFTNGSRSVTTSAIADFRAILSPRDFIKKNTIVSGDSEWYEIIDVKEQEIVLRTPFSGSTEITSTLYKKVKYINDDSLLTVNCLGMEEGGKWIKTPSDAVRHLILNDSGFSSINEASFVQAKADCNFILSLVTPEEPGGKPEKIRDVITKINESVFGSLYGSSSTNISYSIINSTKPETPVIINDDDIISFDAASSGNLFNSITLNYRPFVDHSTGQKTTEVYEYNSGFSDKYIGVKNTLEKTVFLFEEDKAIIIAQRLAFFNQLSNTKLTIKGKMNFFLNQVNDKILVNFERMFTRFGNGDNRKYSVITGIKKSQTEVEVILSDLGNIYNRVPSIAPNDAQDYSSASADQKAQWGYICDNDSLTPDPNSEENLLTNLIG